MRILQRRLVRVAAGAVLIAAIGLSWASGANAFLVTQTGLSGGEPGGLPVFDVSGLVAGDSFPVSWENLLVGVSLTGMVTIDAFACNSATIDVWINNLSPDPDGDGGPVLVPVQRQWKVA